MLLNTTSPLPTSSSLVEGEVLAADLRVGDLVDLDRATTGVRITRVERPAPTARVIRVSFKTSWFAFDFDRTLRADQVVHRAEAPVDEAAAAKLREILAEMAY